MAQITVQKSLDGTTTKSVLNITENNRTTTNTILDISIDTNFVYSAGFIGLGESLQGIIEISGNGMSTQTKTITLKSTSESWNGTAVHTKKDTFNVVIPATTTSVTVTYTLQHSPSGDNVDSSSLLILTKLVNILNAFENNSQMNLEEPLILSITQYDADYINDLVLYFRDAQNTMTEIGSWENVINGQQIQLNQEQIDMLFSLTPDNKFFSLTWRLTTYKGADELGSSDLPSVGLITDANPIFTDFDYEDSNIITTNLTGNNQTVIGGFSTLEITIPTKAIAQKGARIVSYLLADVAVQESENEVSTEIAKYNSDEIVVSAIDSRGNTTTLTKKIQNFKVYLPIEVEQTNATIERTNDSDEQTLISFKGSFWNGNFGAVDNSLKISYKYREAGSTSDFTPGSTLIVPDVENNNFNVYNEAILGDTDEGFGTESSFQIIVEIEDELSIREIEYRLDPGVDAMVIEGNKVLSINGRPYVPTEIKSLAKMHTYGNQTIESGSSDFVNNWTNDMKLQIGDFECDIANGRIKIPAGTANHVRIFGLVAGNGYFMGGINVVDDSDTPVSNFYSQSATVLIQSAGNGYFKEPLPDFIYDIEDTTKDYYVKLNIGGYNSKSFNINSGFGAATSWIAVEKIN